MLNQLNYSDEYAIAMMDVYFDSCEYTDLELKDTVYNLFNMGSEI